VQISLRAGRRTVATYDRTVAPAPLLDVRDLDLASTAVFVDFDGTVSEEDTGIHLLRRLADPGWEGIGAAYGRGEIGSRECLLDEWDLLPKDEQLLREVAREVPIDPAAAPLLAALRAGGAEVTIVSDGFGIRADEVAADLRVPLLTNAPDFSTGRLEFPHEDRCCACSSCGTCKQAPIKDARHRGRTTVMIGDGTSDYKAALLADVVFAKGPLAVWCERNGVPFHRFERLADVQAVLC
jgi:2-hydroxy-3-keto-5-methylthiopentenyl-1-phosphate phosphatase